VCFSRYSMTGAVWSEPAMSVANTSRSGVQIEVAGVSAVAGVSMQAAAGSSARSRLEHQQLRPGGVLTVVGCEPQAEAVVNLLDEHGVSGQRVAGWRGPL
jgi:hypothetical protein